MDQEKQDIFRIEHTDVTEEEAKLIRGIKEKAQELYDMLPMKDGMAINREISVGITSLEDSIMWIVKGLTK